MRLLDSLSVNPLVRVFPAAFKKAVASESFGTDAPLTGPPGMIPHRTTDFQKVNSFEIESCRKMA